jgi:hypothetical protein
MGRKVKIPRRNQRKLNKRNKRMVSSFPKQIQNSQYVPANRLVKFTDFRSYIVNDTGGTPTSSHPPVLQIGLNDPTKFIESLQGDWKANNLGAKGAAVPGITKWLANKVPGTTATSDYLTASCLGSKLDITVSPIAPAADNVSNFQQTFKAVLSNQTRLGHLKGRGIDTSFNAEMVSQMPYVKTANCYLNSGGTPRGASLSLRYSFKKNNANQGKQAENIFYADTSPAEKDIAAFVLMPGDSNGYGIGGTKIPQCKVEVRISYIVLLSEVNTHIGQGINDGNNLSDVAKVLDFDSTSV